FCLLDPEGWILSGLSFHPHHGEVFAVDPDLPAIEELVPGLGQQAKNVLATFGRVLVTYQREIVILRAQRGSAAVLSVGRFLLPLQQFLENMIDDELRPLLRKHAELFRVRSMIGDAHRHFSIVIIGESAILHAIDARAHKAIEGGRTEGIFLLKISYYFLHR